MQIEQLFDKRLSLQRWLSERRRAWESAGREERIRFYTDVVKKYGNRAGIHGRLYEELVEQNTREANPEVMPWSVSPEIPKGLGDHHQ